MTLFKRAPIREWDTASQEMLAKASKRVHKLPSDELCMWSDNAASAMMRAFEDYLKHEDESSLDEIHEGVISLQAIVLELKERHALTHGD
jgi:hypothetical protein